MLDTMQLLLERARQAQRLARRGPVAGFDPESRVGPRSTEGFSGILLGPEWKAARYKAEARARALRRAGARDVEPPV